MHPHTRIHPLPRRSTAAAAIARVATREAQ